MVNNTSTQNTLFQILKNIYRYSFSDPNLLTKLCYDALFTVQCTNVHARSIFVPIVGALRPWIIDKIVLLYYCAFSLSKKFLKGRSGIQITMPF